MANPNFSPDYSTNQIYRDADETRCLTDDLDAIESGLATKASATHSHTEYASVNHTHAQSEISGLAAALNGKAGTTHTHAQTDVTGLSNALAGKASTTHTHTADDVSETTAKKIMTAAERTKLSGIETGANKTVVDTAMSSTSTNPVQNKVVNSALGNKVDKVTGKGLSTNDYTSDEKTKLAGIATGANKYTHPASHPATMITGLAGVATSGSYNDLSNKPTSMTPTAHTHAQSDVSGLATALSGKADTGHTHSAASSTASGFMSKEDKAKLDGIATGANKTTVDSALSSTSANPVQNKVINTALAGKASTSHNHDSAYIAKSLQFMADNGGVEKTFYTSDNTNIITEFEALGMGFHTVYSQAGVSGNPNTTASWRFLIHKASSNIMWVMAFGSEGSIYGNYLNGTSGWVGWRCIYDAAPAALWTGASFMNASQTITPSKKLSECHNGWVLMWSDYDDDTNTANTNDIVTSFIYKRSLSGANWGGAAHYFDIPSYIGTSTTDTSDEKRIIKRLYVYNDKIVGFAGNSIGERRDVVLRAVYEF